jgi:cytochrome c biogenesis protein CcdA
LSLELAQVAQHAGGISLVGTALALGLRHGIDWDHIAAITDIAGGATDARASEKRRVLGLASLYALGHAVVVAILGLAAIYFQALLPEWVDPIMERIVGGTLVLLGLWVLYSAIQYARGAGEFRLQSRWMLLFAGARRGWHAVQHAFGRHSHRHDARPDQYGPRTAFGVGLIHGIGAETGSQVLIIAAVGGAASQGMGTVMMSAFIVGLLISNSLVAFMSATGFVSSHRARNVYVALGVVAGVVSLVIGLSFVLGVGDQLPDLYGLTGFLGVDAG